MIWCCSERETGLLSRLVCRPIQARCGESVSKALAKHSARLPRVDTLGSEVLGSRVALPAALSQLATNLGERFGVGVRETLRALAGGPLSCRQDHGLLKLRELFPADFWSRCDRRSSPPRTWLAWNIAGQEQSAP